MVVVVVVAAVAVGFHVCTDRQTTALAVAVPCFEGSLQGVCRGCQSGVGITTSHGTRPQPHGACAE